MSLYCDTSLIIALLTSERHTQAARAWLAQQAQFAATRDLPG